MDQIEILDGEVFRDERGIIKSLNNFLFDGVKRFYFINHPDRKTVRGWHGHQYEKKWFYCVKGEFVLGFVKPDDWENPSLNLTPTIYKLNEQESKIIVVPEGYANCLKATKDDSILLVLSGKRLPHALNDSWRYNKDLWVDWSKY